MKSDIKTGEELMAGNGLFQNRWWVVFGSFLGLIVSQAAVSFAFGVLLKPVSEDLAVTRRTLSFAFNLFTITSAVFIPIVGFLIDRYRVRTVVMPLIVLFALTTASLSYLRSDPVVLYGLFMLQGVFAACQVPTGYAKTISAWFDRDRGLALGVAMAGVGVGVALMPKFMTYLIQNHGWRNAYIGLGALAFVFTFVPVALFIREPPSWKVSRHGAVPDAIAGLSVAEALRSWHFWAMAIAFFIVIATSNGTLAHVVAMLTDRGIPLDAATTALSMAGLAIIAGRLLSGFCLDRVFAPFVAVCFFCCPIIGILLLLSGASGPVPILGTVLCGLGIGAEVDLMAFFVGRYFGLRTFGAIYGLLFAAFIAGSGLGVYLMALSSDLAAFITNSSLAAYLTGFSIEFADSYAPMLIAFAGALAFACLLIAFLGPYRFPAPGKTASFTAVTP
jgi:predicted MFS family arabinose efflux permease